MYDDRGSLLWVYDEKRQCTLCVAIEAVCGGFVNSSNSIRVLLISKQIVPGNGYSV